jgi:hypothetical protein
MIQVAIVPKTHVATMNEREPNLSEKYPDGICAAAMAIPMAL